MSEGEHIYHEGHFWQVHGPHGSIFPNLCFILGQAASDESYTLYSDKWEKAINYTNKHSHIKSNSRTCCLSIGVVNIVYTEHDINLNHNCLCGVRCSSRSSVHF